MEIINIDENIAELESDYGTYWISFAFDESGKISSANIIDFAWTDDDRSVPPSDELILQEAIALIEESISSESQEDEIYGDPEIVRLVVIARKSGAYAVKIEIDLTENERELFCVAEGDSEVLRALVKPLNTLVSSYHRSSKDPDASYLESLIQQLMFRLSVLWTGTKEIERLSSKDSLLDQMQTIEQRTAALWASCLILKCTEAVSNVMLKRLLRDGADSNFYKMRIQERSRLDIDRFRADHPDLYQKYLVSSESEVLSKAINPRVFPLDGTELRGQFQAALEFIGTISANK